MKSYLLSFTALGLISAALPAVSFAADAAPSATAANPSTEVTVTARRRSEPLRKVPLAVSVIQGEDALRHNLNDLQDITAEVPSTDFRTSSSNKDRTLFIRGIGTISTSPGVEPSVSTVVDGVVLGRSGQATLDLLDIDHVEVLRGPQGTLFGKNASAGVINIVTRDPGADTHGFVDAGLYSGADEYRLSAGLSGSLVKDKLLGSLIVLDAAAKGNVDNLYTGKKVNGYAHQGFRGKLVYTPNDTVTVKLIADDVHSRDSVPNGVFASTSRTAYPTGVVTANPALATFLAGEGVTASANNTTISNDLKSGTRDDNAGLSAEIDWQLGDYTLTSITAYRTWKNTQWQDFDQVSQYTSSFPGVADIGHLKYNQTSQELRLASPKGKFFDYVAGLYYLKAVDAEVYERDLTQLSGTTTVLNNGVATYGTVGKNYAVFAEGNFNFTPTFRAFIGGRALRDELSYSHVRVSTSATALTGIQPSVSSSGSTQKDGSTYRAGLQYDVTPDVASYLTVSHGYKGPAYNVFFNMLPYLTPTGGAPRDSIVLKPETSNSVELGLKSSLFDHHLRLDLAAFDTKFNNYQANFADLAGGVPVTRLINAGKVSTRGFEADATWRATERLTFNGAVAATHARIDHFICPVGAAASCDVDGQPLPYSPDLKYNLRASYTQPVSSGRYVLYDTDYTWQSKTQYQLTETPDTIQKAYGIWNASIGLADDAQGWRLTALVKNIGDTHYSSYLAGGNLGGLVRWVPRDNSRYYGVNLRKTF